MLPPASYSGASPRSFASALLTSEQSIAEGQGYGDPTLLLGSDTEKERGRALKLMGRPWVDSVSCIHKHFP